MECVTFGCPKPGNAAFAEAFAAAVSLGWRVKHGRDLVTKVPAVANYAQAGRELHCGEADPYPSIACFCDLPDHDSIKYITARGFRFRSWQLSPCCVSLTELPPPGSVGAGRARIAHTARSRRLG